MNADPPARRRRLLAPATVAALALSGCGGTTASTTTTGPPSTTGPATTPTTAATTTTTAAAPQPGVLVAGEDGLTIVEASGASRTVGSDPLYPALLTAVADGSGGIVFTHLTTPLPWPQGSILRLAPGALRPEVLVPGEPGALTPTGLTPLDVTAGAGGDPAVLFLEESFVLDDYRREVWQVPLSGGEPTRLSPGGRFVTDADAGGGLVAIAVREADCEWVEYVGLDPSVDRLIPPSPLPAPDCALGRHVEYVALSDDGRRLATVEADAGRRLLRAYDVASARLLAERAVDIAYDLSDAGTAGFVVHLEEVVLAVPGTAGWEVSGLGQWAGRVEGFDLPPDLAAGATLGSGAGTVPCTPGEPPALAAGLPAAVGATAGRIGALAAACDYRGLADLVAADGSSYTFGGPIDPAVLWVTMARHSGHDPLEDTRLMLALPPARQGDLWVWPAVSVTGSADDLARLEATLGRSLQVGPEGYLGWRLGIEGSGRLSFVIAGD